MSRSKKITAASNYRLSNKTGLFQKLAQTMNNEKKTKCTFFRDPHLQPDTGLLKWPISACIQHHNSYWRHKSYIFTQNLQLFLRGGSFFLSQKSRVIDRPPAHINARALFKTLLFSGQFRLKQTQCMELHIMCDTLLLKSNILQIEILLTLQCNSMCT